MVVFLGGVPILILCLNPLDVYDFRCNIFVMLFSALVLMSINFVCMFHSRTLC